MGRRLCRPIQPMETQMTLAEKIARVLNTDWEPIDDLLRMGYSPKQIIKSYVVPSCY